MPSRRSLIQATGSGLAIAAFASVASLASLGMTRAARQATPAMPEAPSADELVAITRQVMDDLALRSTIMQVAINGDVLLTEALGESMTGVPATIDMRFRNGVVAISLISTLMLTLVDDDVIGLNDPIGDLVPNLPDEDTTTFRMLANMTAGYRDHVQNTEFLDANLDDPFRAYTPDDSLAYRLAQPRLIAPGTNWEYSHTNYVILGLALEAATGQSVERLMQERVLDPLKLTATTNDATGQIPEPALHAFTSERRERLGLDPETRFYEESTYWNPSWTLTRGAVQTSDIRDFGASMVAVGDGTLLSPESKAAQLDQGLRGVGAPLDGCATCRTLGSRTFTGWAFSSSGRGWSRTRSSPATAGSRRTGPSAGCLLRWPTRMTRQRSTRRPAPIATPACRSSRRSPLPLPLTSRRRTDRTLSGSRGARPGLRATPGIMT